ncbi:iron ABC transporter permease [Pseudoalteromonas tunicata]|uniref:FecCD family ABC transporter permease n=1 Tax=Pseudoalteromonas tunicata TaxID=314281 RepID=UPI0027400280|nr:iron ABC transporter permease [Pseudoalteromonas tunicata]MDP5213366.1 iron ABC transporter permease [Pseudoalteromonas tunicata]
MTTLTFMLLLCIGLVSLNLGDFELTISDVFSALTTPNDSMQSFVVWQLRMPRYIVAILAGAALATAGVITQTVTQNELASPSLVGVSSGAALAIVIGMVVFNLPPKWYTLAGFIGGCTALIVAVSLAWRYKLQAIDLLLAGMCISLLCAAAITILLISISTDTRGIFYWLIGSVANRTWQHVNALAPLVLFALALSFLLIKRLNILQLDDNIVKTLGGKVISWRIQALFIAVLLTAATVAATGPISFIGLVAPHIARLLLGSRYAYNLQFLLPLSAICGAVLVASADLLANYQEIPVGILCVLFGGPTLLLLIQSKWRQGSTL